MFDHGGNADGMFFFDLPFRTRLHPHHASDAADANIARLGNLFREGQDEIDGRAQGRSLVHGEEQAAETHVPRVGGRRFETGVRGQIYFHRQLHLEAPRFPSLIGGFCHRGAYAITANAREAIVLLSYSPGLG